MKFLQSTIVIAFCLMFFLFGVVIMAPVELAFNATLLCLAIALAFYIPVSSLLRRTANSAATITERSTLLASRLTMGATVLPHAWFYLMGPVGVPILSDNVELARMVLVSKYGAIYRLATQAVFFYAALLVARRVAKHITLGKFVTRYVFCLILLLSEGFRSRLLDLVAISLVAAFITLKGVRGKKFHIPTRVLAYSGLAAFASLGAIVYLTSVRTGAATVADAFDTVIYRVFFLNFEVNFDRIFRYVATNGYMFGSTFVTDLLSLVDGQYDSMQVLVTRHFNQVNSNYFIMTPTVYGEFFLNFGSWGFLLALPIVLSYRILYERFLAYASRFRIVAPYFLAASVNYIYYVPRQVATGGVANAFYIRGLSILLLMISLSTFALLLEGMRARQTGRGR